MMDRTDATGSNMGGNIGVASYDNTPANLMNRFSPKVSLGSEMSTVF